MRKQGGRETVWLSQRLVMATCELQEEYLRTVVRKRYKATVRPCHRHHNTLPDTGKSWRWARLNGGFYYDLARLPNRQPACYRDYFGDAEALIKHYHAALAEESHRALDKELKEFIKMRYQYYLKEYADCTGVQQAALAKACAVLDFTAARLEGAEKPCRVYREVCAAVSRQDLRYLPKNERVLRQKVECITKQGQTSAQVVRLPRAGNTNASRFHDPAITACAIKMRAMPQNYTNEFIIRTIQNAYRARGQKVPSRRWFGMKVFEHPRTKYLTAAQRYGQGSRKAFEQTGYIPMQNALFAGDCWQLDATRVNMIEHTMPRASLRGRDNSAGKGFLFIVAVRDVHSGDLLGYSFDYSENRWSVLNALKMAVENTGYLPFELVTDRFPGHNTDEVKRIMTSLKHIGTRVTTTHRPTGKAHLERAFSTLQTVFMQKSQYYYGQGVQSRRPYAHRAPEYLKEVRKQAAKEGFDFAAAWQQAVSVVESYRNTKLSHYSRKHAGLHKSPAELHHESQKPNTTKLEAHQISMLFGLKKKVSIKHNGQIRTEIQKAEYIYHVDDFEVQANHKEVVLSYDLEDPDKVFLFKERDGMLVYLCQACRFRKPQPYGPGRENGKIAAARLRLKDIEQRKVQALKEALAAAGNEVELMMGPFTEKTAAEEAETARMLLPETEQTGYKKAAGIEFNGDLDIDDYIINQL